jgi:uncharacterized membrane protein YdjX (TVP38/TMEM64 family)
LRALRIAVLVLLAAALGAGAIWATQHLDELDPERIAASLRAYGALAPLAFTAVRVIAAVLLLPNNVVAIAAGTVFGPFWGTVWNVVAATLGAVIAFSIARFVAPGWATKAVKGHDKLAALMRTVEAEGWRSVAFVRLMPLLPYNLLNYALGLTTIRLSQYTAATFVFMIPIDVAYSYIGYAGYQAMTGHGGALRSVLIAVGLIAALLFVPMLARAYQRQRGRGNDAAGLH